MPCGIHSLQVKQHQIRRVQRSEGLLSAGIAAGVNGRMNAFCVTQPDQFLAEGTPTGGLAAADGHAAAGTGQVGLFPPDAAHQVFRGVPLAKQPQGILKAGCLTPAAADAFGAVDFQRSCLPTDCPLRANGHTVRAAGAAVGGKKAYLRLKGLPLRIAAPFAAQTAAFQEDRRPDARSIHKRAVDQIKDRGAERSLFHGEPSIQPMSENSNRAIMSSCSSRLSSTK